MAASASSAIGAHTEEAPRVRVLLYALGLFHAHVAAAAEAVDLPIAQAMLLRELTEPLPMRDIASRRDCDPSNITGIIDRLEQRGLVARTPAEHDRRVRLLTLTPLGDDARTRFITALGDAIPLFDALDASDSEALESLLERALDASDVGFAHTACTGTLSTPCTE